MSLPANEARPPSEAPIQASSDGRHTQVALRAPSTTSSLDVGLKIMSFLLEHEDELKKPRLDDPTMFVLPAVHANQNLSGHWTDYALFIVYGPKDKRTERCIALDQPALLIYKILKDRGETPIVLLKSKKVLPSPIAFVRKSAAARKDGETSPGTGPTPDRPLAPPTTGESGSCHEHSPEKSTMNAGEADGSLAVSVEKLNLSSSSMDNLNETTPKTDTDKSEGKYAKTSAPHFEKNPTAFGIAVYPMKAQNDGDLDVEVGETFVILDQTDTKWWNVQRDVTRSGKLEADVLCGRVPAGCLLLTTTPVHYGATIFPKDIVSKGRPMVALLDFKGSGKDDEADLLEGETLVVYKNHFNWAYIVKDDGYRGWVPGWYLGRIKS